MIQILDKSMCVGCHACYSCCAFDCISMTEDEEGFLYPNADKKKCVECKKCEMVCPVLRRPTLRDYDESCFAAYSKKECIRLKSSSGGVFSVLAGTVIKHGGVVFGAAFDKEFQVHHVQITSLGELEKLRGSKYVQSRIEETYREAKKYLECGREVYFSGTPCQIDGLVNYLGKEFDNLITQDIICHGVPAPIVWEKYVEQVKGKLCSDIKSITFRDKTFGWKKYSLKIEGTNNSCEMGVFLENPMMRAYLRDVCLRPSCYKCPSRGVKRSSDITLADFWDINDYLDDFDDNKGVDLIICHSEKGSGLLKESVPDLIWREVDIRAANENIPMNISPRLPKNRQKFIQELERYNFTDVVEKYCSIPFSHRFYTRMKLILKKIRRK